MPNSKDLFNDLFRQLTLDDSEDEKKAILYLLLEHQYGLSRTAIQSGRMIAGHNGEQITAMIDRLNTNEPLQYVLGEAGFFGRKFLVNPSVLIPRPETELIITELLATDGAAFNGNILDIGTGSGCIAVTLALEMKGATVTGVDISAPALRVASANAARHGAQVQFVSGDILSGKIPEGTVDRIVSNPPYVTPGEMKDMQANVLEFEPHLALFAPENNPLIFYTSIARTGIKILGSKGRVVTEINSHFGNATAEVFRREGYAKITVKKDLDQKDRILIADR